MKDEYSEDGSTALAITGKAGNFTDWMFAQIRPYLHGTVLEIGSGIGTYSEKVIREAGGAPVMLSEYDPSFVDNLKKMFAAHPDVSVHRIDMGSRSDLDALPHTPDTVFALNVLEHVEHDEAALANIYHMLPADGTLILLVPAHKWLYNNLDRAVGHFRRYTRSELEGKAAGAGFSIEKTFYFNALSMAGWFVNGTLMRKSVVDEGAVGLLNLMVPCLSRIEKSVLRQRIGISLISVLRKK